MSPRMLVALIAVLGTPACGVVSGPEDDPLFVEEGDRFFTLVNTLERDTLTWAAVTRREDPLVLLAPCTDWPRLGPGQRQVVRHDDVPGYQGPGTDEALIRWCRLRGGASVEGGSTTAPL